jgi:hypothetical protein
MAVAEPREANQPRPAARQPATGGSQADSHDWQPACEQATARGLKGAPARQPSDGRLDRNVRRKRKRAKRSFQVVDTCIFDYKRGEIHLMAWFARGQRFETYFCEVHVRNGKTANRNVWNTKFAIFSSS